MLVKFDMNVSWGLKRTSHTLVFYDTKSHSYSCLLLRSGMRDMYQLLFMNFKQQVAFNSLNVRELNNSNKRQTIFQWLKTKHKGIVLLQETYSQEKDELEWMSDWGNKIVFSHGTRHSSGVAVLLDNTYDYDLIDIKRDDQGRFLLLNIEINKESFILINVYAPTQDNSKEQKQFFEKLSDILDEFIGCNIILGGDFNVCLNPAIDKQGGVRIKQSDRAKQVNLIAENNDLIDIWRALNEDKKCFTWRSLYKTWQSFYTPRFLAYIFPLSFRCTIYRYRAFN